MASGANVAPWFDQLTTNGRPCLAAPFALSESKGCRLNCSCRANVRDGAEDPEDLELGYARHPYRLRVADGMQKPDADGIRAHVGTQRRSKLHDHRSSVGDHQVGQAVGDLASLIRRSRVEYGHPVEG